MLISIYLCRTFTETRPPQTTTLSGRSSRSRWKHEVSTLRHVELKNPPSIFSVRTPSSSKFKLCLPSPRNRKPPTLIALMITMATTTGDGISLWELTKLLAWLNPISELRSTMRRTLLLYKLKSQSKAPFSTLTRTRISTPRKSYAWETPRFTTSLPSSVV